MVSLDSTCKVEVFSSYVNVDRYHLLRFDNWVHNEDIIYEENGCAFNGFYNPLILNVSADVVCNSRLLALTLLNVNNSSRVFYLITNVEYITNNKCRVYIEYDAWMNLKSIVRYGEQNNLFQCSDVLTNYPYSDVHADYFTYEKITNIFECRMWNYIIFYHNSSDNFDYVYIIKTPKFINDFLPYSQEMVELMEDFGIDTNSIISMYMSPFDIDTSDIPVHPREGMNVYFTIYNYFVYYESLRPLVGTYGYTYSPFSKMVITDANGASVWMNNRQTVGNLETKLYLDLTYSYCMWTGYIGEDLPHTRFSIQCLNLGFFMDYFQQYQNLEKDYNHSVRMAQLDLQIQEGIGDTIAAGTWHGTSSGMSMSPAGGKVAVPQTATLGLAGGLVGGAIQTAISGVATNEYYNKLERIETKKAKLQYDMISSNTSGFFKFLTGQTTPAIYTMFVDVFNYYANREIMSTVAVALDYNCHIHGSSLQNLIEIIQPNYISGDFDFIGINEEYAIQLNSRFKHGVNFVNWRDSDDT